MQPWVFAKNSCTRDSGCPERHSEDPMRTFLVPAIAGTIGFLPIPTVALARIRELLLPWAKIYPPAVAGYHSLCLSRGP